RGSPAGKRHYVVIRGTPHVTGRIRVVGRPFPARALAQDAAQAQENEYRQRQKNDGVDIEHVLHALGSRGAAGSAASLQIAKSARQRSVPAFMYAPARSVPEAWPTTAFCAGP